MGMDFNVDVNVKTHGAEEVNALEKSINSLVAKSPVKINVELDSKSINTANFGKQIQSSLNNSVKSVKFDGNTFYSQYFAQAEKDLKEAKRVETKYKQTLKNLDTSEINKKAIKAANARRDAELKVRKEIAKIKEQEYESYYNPKRDAYQSLGNRSNIQSEMSAYYKQLEIESARQAKEYEKIISKTKANIFNGRYDAKSSTMTTQLSSYTGQNTQLLVNARQQAELYNNTITNLKRHFDTNDAFKMNDEDVVSSFNNMANAAEKFDNTMTQIRNTGSKSLGLGVAKRSSDEVENYMNANSRALKKYKTELIDLQNQYRQMTTVAEKADLDNKFKNLKTTISAEGLSGRSFTEELGRGMKVIGQFAATYGIIHRIPEYAMKAAKAVVEVDTAMTELRKVSNDSEDAQIGQYFDHATESAKKYGAAINEVINSAADWKRLGYSVQDAAKLSDATTLLQRVGDNMTQESSSQGLISILKGFNYQADQVNSIIDVINQVANTEPIDTAGIVSALQRSASSLSAAGNDLNQSVSMITAANSVLQDPDVVGTAMRTLSMRIRGAKTDLENAGLETEGMAESTAKLREEMIALSGVDIMQDNNTFKSTYAILDELADKWQGLSDIQQASVTELIAGKRQGAVMSALMSNWNIAEDTMKQAAGADGSAEKELGNYQKSIQYSLDKMKATAQEFANATLDSSWLKAGVDGAQVLLEVLTKIMDIGGGIPAVLGAIGAVKLFKNLD